MMEIDEATLAEVERVRAACKKADNARDAGLPTTVAKVNRINAIAYGPDRQQTLDVSSPVEVTGSLPVIVNVHGGGWVYGTTETYQFYCMALAKAGFAVVSFNYRMPPSVQFPGELDDVDLVMHWVVEHATEHRFDLCNVFMVGDSAGGQMVEQYVTILANPSYRELFGYSKPNLSVRAAALNCSACFMLDEMITGAIAAYFTPSSVVGHEQLLDVEGHMTRELPPLFLLTANDDFLRDRMNRLDGYLTAKGIEHEIASFGDAEHPREHVFHVNQKDPVAAEANRQELDFFRSHMA